MARLSSSEHSSVPRPRSLPTLRLPAKIRAAKEAHSTVCTMCHQELAGSTTTKSPTKVQFRKKLSQLKPDLARKLDTLLGHHADEPPNASRGGFLSGRNSAKPSRIREISDKVQAKVLRKKLSKHTISAPILVTASSTIGTIPIESPASELAASQRPLASGAKKVAQLLSIAPKKPSPDLHKSASLSRMTCELKSTKDNVRALGISSFNEFYKPRHIVNTPFSTAYEMAQESLSSFSSGELTDCSDASPAMCHCELQNDIYDLYKYKEDQEITDEIASH
ncbi:hypothetical protein K493DRAFT_350077 [Basidiobolus meristosporus CBS 931.73]|uniref:Uncharacterized protein n=1 Tax=Basidiobolus meristosporus CBS 931.73 TaxID=1314790 RepID=A0A1Y1YHB1_9FUNG|nr:hypothetical protein K493DRAFT_350077 [Basidiobolus meristosporus CBS 931.73]|eukprot:ORX97421.1 hypothetical protein K493DRAFT_350077 [Basidiobolus meristosporus CBS 931.73]